MRVFLYALLFVCVGGFMGIVTLAATQESEFRAECKSTEYYTFVRGYASRIYDCSGVDIVESRKSKNIEH